MRKLLAAAQEKPRRRVIGLRRAGMAYDAIAAQVSLTRAGVFKICHRNRQRDPVGLKSGRKGPALGHDPEPAAVGRAGNARCGA
ncbi:MAG: hypothetical protein ACJ8AW_08885 [Rhodopila sp.]